MKINDIGPEFKRVLDMKKLTQKDLADYTGMSPQAVGVLLKEGASRWKVNHFDAACRYLGLHPGTFLESWPEGGMVISDIDNSTYVGNTNFSVGSQPEASALLAEKDARIEEQKARIRNLEMLVRTMQVLMQKSGIELE